MLTLENVLSELKSKGFKSTKYRTSLLQLLFSSDKPVSVLEMLQAMSGEDLVPNKTTVYRELYFLMEHGIVTELDLGDEKKRYELAHMGHHHHLICTNCKNIEDVVFEENLAGIEEKIRVEKQFMVKDHSMEFYGLCKNCQL